MNNTQARQFPDGEPTNAMESALKAPKPLRGKPNNGKLLTGAEGLDLPAISIPIMENVEALRQRREKFKQFAEDAIEALLKMKEYVIGLRAIPGWQDDQKIVSDVEMVEKQIVEIEKVPAVRDQLLYRKVAGATSGDEFISALQFGRVVSARGEEWKVGADIEYPRIKPLPKEEGKEFLNSFKKEEGKFDGWRFGLSGVAYRGLVFKYFVPDAGHEDSPFHRDLKNLIRQRRIEFADKDLSEAQVGELEEKGKIEEAMKDPRFKPISDLEKEYVPGLYIAHSPAYENRPEGAVIFEVYFHKGRGGREIAFMKPVEFHGSNRNLESLVGTYMPLDYVLRGEVPERMAENMSEEKFEKLGHFAQMIRWRFFHARAK